MADTVKLSWNRIAKLRDKDVPWRAIAEKYGVSASTVMRCYDDEEDRIVRRRNGKKAKPELAEEVRQANNIIETVDQRPMPPMQLDEVLSTLAYHLGKHGVVRLVMDVPSGRCEVHTSCILNIGEQQ